jgi:hypothetical protein
MPQYLILLYDNPSNWKTMSPEEIEQAFRKFVAWRNKIRDSGRLKGSNKLTDGEGRVMRGKGDVRVTDGPFTEGKEVLGGYYLFEADNFEHAVELTRDNPGLAYGGTIEVRQVEDLSQRQNNA